MRADDDPPRLRGVIEDARRLAEELTLDELLACLHDEWAHAWLAGRPGEIEQVVEQVRAAFRQGRVDEVGAVAALAGYLDELRRGMARHLGGADGATARTTSDARTVLDRGGEATDEETARHTVDAELLDLTRRRDRSER